MLRAWPALGSRNFRLFIGGQAVSLAGTFMQQVAMGWLVYRLTQSPLALGAVAFATEIAGVAVVLLGGALIDRHNPHRIVIATQSLAMLQAFALAALVAADAINLAGIVALSCMLGLANGIDVPARQVLVFQLVDRRHLGNAIVLTSLALDGARLVGPALGGALVARVGEWLCFLLNGLSYLAVIAALLAMKIEPRPAATHPVRYNVADGIRFAWRTAPIRRGLLLVAVVSFAGGPYAVLMPVMAAEALGGGSHTLGLLMASSGIGALGGAAYLWHRGSADGYDRLMGRGAAIFGACLILFALSRSLPLSLALLAIAGFGIMTLMACTHTALLILAEEDKRGRVMSLFTLSFMATVPFGSLLAGAIASVVGTPVILALGGGACVLAAAFYRLGLGDPLRDRRRSARSA